MLGAGLQPELLLFRFCWVCRREAKESQLMRSACRHTNEVGDDDNDDDRRVATPGMIMINALCHADENV